jgi:hypothetical protein
MQAQLAGCIQASLCGSPDGITTDEAGTQKHEEAGRSPESLRLGLLARGTQRWDSLPHRKRLT